MIMKSKRKSTRKSNRKSKTINGGMHSSRRRSANHRLSDEEKALKTAEAAAQGIACAQTAVQVAEHAREQARLAVAAATRAIGLKEEVNRVLSKLIELNKAVEKAEMATGVDVDRDSVVCKLRKECAADGLGKLMLSNNFYSTGTYYGQVQDGKPHGLGTLFHENDRFLYEGNFVDGKIDGLGTLYFLDIVDEVDTPTPPFYAGEWKNDEPHGVGRQTLRTYYLEGAAYHDAIHEGQFKDGKMHGRGTCKYGEERPQDVYEGEWKNEDFNGFGVNTFGDGGVYKGEYANDLINGHGTYEDGTRTTKYSGYFENDHLVRGKGTTPMPVGVYTGDMTFKNRRLIASGNGILHYYNGDIYEGNFRNNKKYGRGTLTTLAPDTVQTGMWFDNKMDGTITYPNGTTVRGEFVDGVSLALLNVLSDLSDDFTDS